MNAEGPTRSAQTLRGAGLRARLYPACDGRHLFLLYLVCCSPIEAGMRLKLAGSGVTAPGGKDCPTNRANRGRRQRGKTRAARRVVCAASNVPASGGHAIEIRLRPNVPNTTCRCI